MVKYMFKESCNIKKKIATPLNEPKVQAVIAFGSNLGDPRKNVKLALELLEKCNGIIVVRTSSFYETPPVGGPLNQPAFLNGVVLIWTMLEPFALLEELQRIEETLHRVRREFWGPRTIDLDLIVYGDMILETPSLTIPHPRILWRDFVLAPTCEIAPDLIVPSLHASFHELRLLLMLSLRLFPLTTFMLGR